MKLVVALGGNMLTDASNKQETFEDQRARSANTATLLIDIQEKGYNLVITHGNGPQVGSLLLQQQADVDGAINLPLNVLGALTQGQIGVVLQHALINEYRKRNNHHDVIVIPTTVIVNGNDPGFTNPTKPVGPFYSEEEYQNMDKNPDYVYVKLSKGWRRIVASPYPESILESELIDEISKKSIVIAVGGGGSPTVDQNGELQLVDAVIDKDLASARLAQFISADLYLIITNIDGVYSGFNTPDQKKFDTLTVEQAQALLDAGELGAGSMAPKVKAAMEFSEYGDTIITSPDQVLEALQGRAGTRITK